MSGRAIEEALPLHARADEALGLARRRTFHGRLRTRLEEVYGAEEWNGVDDG